MFGFWNILSASHQVAERKMGSVSMCARVYVRVLCTVCMCSVLV